MNRTLPARLGAARMDSPLGSILLLHHGDRLTGLYFEGQRHGPKHDPDRNWGDPPPAVREALQRYFERPTTPFLVALELRGTPFQCDVWHALQTIPSGRTATYADIARAIGRPAAVRAVGAAIGRNPVSIIVPCHRVLGSDGSLTGYAGGTERKRWLLVHEGVPLDLDGREKSGRNNEDARTQSPAA